MASCDPYPYPYSRSAVCYTSMAMSHIRSDMAYTIPKRKVRYQCLYCLGTQKKDTKACKSCGAKDFVKVELDE